MPLIPVILSGGAGTRLWPVSRELHPKPFIRLKDGRSLLNKTFARAANFSDVHEILIATHSELFFKTVEEFNFAVTQGIKSSYLLEPFGRNTASSIAMAATHLAATNGLDAVLLVLPADHVITEENIFQECVHKAKILANEGHIVTFGITVSRPETAYGYILSDGHKVKQFIEKPSLDVAQTYFQSGNYHWNAGIFCAKAGTILNELEKWAPDLLIAAQLCLEVSRTTHFNNVQKIELDAQAFLNLPDISIDYALMEKSQKMAMVPCDMGWQDVGSWDAMAQLEEADQNGNHIVGDVALHETSNCLIRSDKRLVAAVGLSNVVIIDTPDALLVANKDAAQDVKNIVAQLKNRNHNSHKIHTEVHRPWGTYSVIEEGMGYKIKRLVVKPHAALSLQMHVHRSEHWIVISGVAKVSNDKKEAIINVNESTYIPAGKQHRIENPGDTDLVIIEVQSGNYLGEDDIVRFEDCYGRAEA